MPYRHIAEKLTVLGLSEESAETYLVLIVHGPCKASDFASLAKTHRNAAYRRLEDLVREGVAEIVLEEPRQYKAIPLAALVETARGNLRARESGMAHVLDQVGIDLEALQRGAPSVPRRPTYRSIHGRQRALETRIEMLGHAKNRVRSALSAVQTIEAALELGVEEAASQAVRRGVRISLLVGPTVSPDTVALLPAGVEVRTHPNVVPIFVMDEAEALVPVHVEKRSGRNVAEDVWLRTDGATAIRCQGVLFDLLWEQATPATVRDPPTRPFSARGGKAQARTSFQS